jgi:hypothetical protein
LQPFQLSKLMGHAEVQRALEILTADSYRADIKWLKTHFRFAASQQIDWPQKGDVVLGQIDQLSADEMQTLLGRHGVQPQRRVHVIWAYGDFGVILPVQEVGTHIDDIWFPATDDVFILDPADDWCLELHHEGIYSCGRYMPMHPVTGQ